MSAVVATRVVLKPVFGKSTVEIQQWKSRDPIVVVLVQRDIDNG